jgi:hypothetical protein
MACHAGKRIQERPGRHTWVVAVASAWTHTRAMGNVASGRGDAWGEETPGESPTHLSPPGSPMVTPRSPLTFGYVRCHAARVPCGALRAPGRLLPVLCPTGALGGKRLYLTRAPPWPPHTGHKYLWRPCSRATSRWGRQGVATAEPCPKCLCSPGRCSRPWCPSPSFVRALCSPVSSSHGKTALGGAGAVAMDKTCVVVLTGRPQWPTDRALPPPPWDSPTACACFLALHPRVPRWQPRGGGGLLRRVDVPHTLAPLWWP